MLILPQDKRVTNRDDGCLKDTQTNKIDESLRRQVRLYLLGIQRRKYGLIITNR